MKQNLFLFKNGEATPIQLKPFIFELAMEGYLADNPAILSNVELGLEDPEVMEVEEQIDSDNRIDMLLRYTNDSIAVVELKKGIVNDKALQQLIRYLQIEKVEQQNQAEGDEDSPLIGILVGMEIDENVIQKIEGNNSPQGFLIYGVELQRYYDEGNWYVFTNWYAPKSVIGKKDYTKYILNKKKERLLGKGRLVYEVVKDYMATHPGITFADVQKVFPDSLRNAKSSVVKHHVVELEGNVEPKDRYARYFKEPLSCVDGNLVVSSQWGIGNIKPFIDYAKTIGYSIEEV